MLKEKQSNRTNEATSKVLCILLVEHDNPDTQLIRDTLKKHIHPGCRLYHVNSITKAERILRLCNDFDIILLDLGLPDAEDAREAFSKISRLAPDIPVIILNSTNDHKLAVALLSEGVEDCLYKSTIRVDPARLCEAVEYAICRYHHMKQALAMREQIIQEKENILKWMSGGYMR